MLKDEKTNADPIEKLTRWCLRALTAPEGRAAVKGWASFRLPEGVDMQRVSGILQEELEQRSLPSRIEISGTTLLIRPVDSRTPGVLFEDALRRDLGNYALPKDILFVGSLENRTFRELRERFEGAPVVEVNHLQGATNAIEQLLGEWNEFRFAGSPILHVSASKVSSLGFKSRWNPNGEEHSEFKKHYLQRRRADTLFTVFGNLVHQVFGWIAFTRVTTGILPSPEQVATQYLKTWNRQRKPHKPMEPRTQEILDHLYSKAVHLLQMYEGILPILRAEKIIGSEIPFIYIVRQFERRHHGVKLRVATTGKFDLLTVSREEGKNILTIHDFKTGLEDYGRRIKATQYFPIPRN